MRKTLIALCAFTRCITAAKAQESHVILISIDGLRPEFYKDPSWNMVNLRQAMQDEGLLTK